MKTFLDQPILVVEREYDDRQEIETLFRQQDFMNPIYGCSNAEEALDYLFQRGDYGIEGKAPRPALVLLGTDIGEPGTVQLLREMKADYHFKNVPVMILSPAEEEEQEDPVSYLKAGASYVVTVPLTVQDVIEAMNLMQGYWFQTVLLPKGES